MSRSWLVLADGFLTQRSAKTAHGVLRYTQDDVAGVIDREHAGKDLIEILPELGRKAPIVASVSEGIAGGATSLLLGVATPGGWLPGHWRDWVKEAIEAGLEIVNGLHGFLREDEELVRLAEDSGARLWDVRDPPGDIPLFSGKSLEVPQRTVLTVGSDCAVGKMTTALELANAARVKGVDAEFVATGQTGIMIAGRGIAVDRVISDFTSGAAEKVVLESNPSSSVLLVEGQGSLWHPAYSGVTLGLLHGTAPEALVFCHQPNRTQIEEPPFTRLPSLIEMIDTYEHLARFLRPAKVACISISTRGLDEDVGRWASNEIEETTGIPTGDVFHGDAPKLWAALAEHLALSG